MSLFYGMNELKGKEHPELPEEWVLLASDPVDRDLLARLFKRVSVAGADKAKMTEILIAEVENFKSVAIKKKFYYSIATSLDESGDKKKAKFYYDKIVDTGDGVTLPVRIQLIDRFYEEKKYSQLLPLINEGLNLPNVPNVMKAEWICTRLMVFIIQDKVKQQEIINECKKIELLHYENEKEVFERFHRLASDLDLKGRRQEALLLMKWLKEERYKDEYGIDIFNNYAFLLSRSGQKDESEKVREELITRKNNDPAVFPQIQLLIYELIDRNTPQSHAQAKKLCESLLANPVASSKVKQEAERNIELLRRIELGLSTDKILQTDLNSEWNEQELVVKSPSRAVFRLSLFLTGIFMIVLVFYLRHRFKQSVDH